MLKKRNRTVAATLTLIVLAGPGCGLFGGGLGACVSSPVSYSFGQRVYCYSEWSSDDCAINDSEQVNGASWVFHSGQTCEDRDLVDGSNPWP